MKIGTKLFCYKSDIDNNIIGTYDYPITKGKYYEITGTQFSLMENRIIMIEINNEIWFSLNPRFSYLYDYFLSEAESLKLKRKQKIKMINKYIL